MTVELAPKTQLCAVAYFVRKDDNCNVLQLEAAGRRASFWALITKSIMHQRIPVNTTE